MKIDDAVGSFTDWSSPWLFASSVREKIAGTPEELASFEAMFTEASHPNHWRDADLAIGCKVAQRETKKKFPHVGDEVVAAVVRAASYNWR